MPAARFIHLIRDGRDVVASFYRLCLEAPELWVPQVMGRKTADLVESASGRTTVLAAVIDRWNDDVRRSLELASQSGHQLVWYDDLVTVPEKTLTTICEGLGLAFEDAMLRHWEAAPQVVGHRSDAAHMQKPFERLAHEPLRTFRSVFTDDQREQVQTKLLNGGTPPIDRQPPRTI